MEEAHLVFYQDMDFVIIHPNPEFLVKDDSASFRRKPLVIKSFKLASGANHCLFHVLILKAFIKASKHLKVDKLFVNPRTFNPCSKTTISHLIRRLV